MSTKATRTMWPSATLVLVVCLLPEHTAMWIQVEVSCSTRRHQRYSVMVLLENMGHQSRRRYLEFAGVQDPRVSSRKAHYISWLVKNIQLLTRPWIMDGIALPVTECMTVSLASASLPPL